MPALYALGQHAAIETVVASLHEGEHLFAFLDDIYIVCSLERVVPIYRLLEAALAEHCDIVLHQGKTEVWNRANNKPPDCDSLGPNVWRGSSELLEHSYWFGRICFEILARQVGGARSFVAKDSWND